MHKPVAAKLAICSLLVVFITGRDTVLAQNNQNSIAIMPFYGLSISSPVNDQFKGNFFGTEFAYQLNMAGNDTRWVNALNVKDIGFVFSYFDLRKLSLASTPNTNGLLGSNFGLLTCVDLSFYHIGKIDFLFSPAIGLNYATQTYYTTNNLIVGSHINLVIQAGIKSQTPISPSTRLQIFLNFFHYSNSAFKLPNDGVNTYNASVGIVQDVDTKGSVRQKATFGINEKRSFEFGIGIGRRGLIQPVEPLINTQTGKPIPPTDTTAQKKAVSNLYQAGLYAGYNYRISEVFSVKAGTDIVYYFRPFSYQDFYQTYQESGTSFDKFSVGLSLGTDLWLGRMAFMANYGYYLHFVSTEPTHTYWTLGGKYYLNSFMAINAKIYIHTLEAHYANFGLIFNLKD